MVETWKRPWDYSWNIHALPTVNSTTNNDGIASMPSAAGASATVRAPDETQSMRLMDAAGAGGGYGGI